MSLNEALAKAKAAAEAYTPSLFDLTRFYTNQGFCGDEKNRLALALAVLGRKCIGIESLSGTGKTVMSDIAISLLEPSWVFHMGMQSEKVAHYLFREIEKSRLLYVPELQKAIAASGKIVVEILKDFGEGKASRRMVRDQARMTNKEYVIPWRPFIYTLATENEVIPDAELSRRVLKLPTDITEKQTREVLRMKAMRRFNPTALRVMSEENEFALRTHFQTAYVMASEMKLQYTNPYGMFIAEAIPAKFVQARTAIDHYLDMTQAVAKFFLPAGLRYMADGMVFMSLEDNWLCHRIYGEPFTYDVMQMPPQGRFVMRALRKTDRPLTLPDIQTMMAEDGVTVKQSVLKELVNRAVSAGYIFADPTMKFGGYLATPLSIEFETSIDWARAFEAGKAAMKEIYPHIYDEWLKHEHTETIDPITGEKVNILEHRAPVAVLTGAPKEEEKKKKLEEFI